MSKPAHGSGSETIPGDLLFRVRQLLEPLATLAVGRVPFDELSELLRQAMVQAAEQKLLKEDPGKRITKSALALQTGIDSRLIERQPTDGGEERDFSHPFADLLAMWQWDEQWHDAKTGEPAILDVYGSRMSFQTLVNRSIGKNISYSEVLQTLLTTHNVERTRDNRIRLLDPIYKYGASELERGRLDFYGKLSEGLAHCIRERMASTEFNSTPNAVLMVERSIPEHRIQALAEDMGRMLLRHAEEAGDRLDADNDSNARGRTFTAGVGNFFWTRRNNE